MYENGRKKITNNKTAVVLLNLGGPDNLTVVKNFLFNLFNDKAIINLPQPFRYCLAKFIAITRQKKVVKIYQKLGGKSPLLANTIKQQQAIGNLLGEEFKVFLAMRYWHPQAQVTVQHIAHYCPQRIVLVPLYPQYSTTTTASSIADFLHWQQKYLPKIKVKIINNYATADGFILSIVYLLQQYLKNFLTSETKCRVLFSAHGIPEYLVQKGDPYQQQIIASVNAVIAKMDEYFNLDHIDYNICYQSKIGPLKWLSPYIIDELKRAACDKVAVIIVPIAFVSEHLETLYELDIEYKKIADDLGIIKYMRVPTVSCHPTFIQCLADIIKNKV